MVEDGEGGIEAAPSLGRLRKLVDSPEDILRSSAVFDTGNSQEFPLVPEDNDKLEIHPSNSDWSQRPSCLQESSPSPCRSPGQGNCIGLYM